MFKKLYDHFNAYTPEQIPIETDDISAAIISCLHMQDEIICSPEDLDPKEVKGVFYQYTERDGVYSCLLYTSPSPRDGLLSRMPSSA